MSNVTTLLDLARRALSGDTNATLVFEDALIEAGGISDPCVDERRAMRELAYKIQAGYVLSDHAARVAVVVRDGTTGPVRAGEPGYHTTPSGKTVVRHPGAYGWRTVYHCTTLRVEVSRAWLFVWRCEGGVYAHDAARARDDAA